MRNRAVLLRTLLPLLLIGLLGTASELHAQHGSRGRQFWVTFLPNLGSAAESSDLRLYLSSEVPTVARVIYHMRQDTMIVPLPVPRTTVEVDISDRFGSSVEVTLGETIVRKAIEVIADSDITVYGVNIRSKSADAFLALPDDVLTSTYIVLAYPNGFDSTVENYDTPSMFAVVGTEDGTTVRITPSTDIVGRGRTPFSIGLDRGQVYFGQARTYQWGDVSGTEIRSNKPVAVFGGNRRTSIPLSVGNFRDHLIEQIPPLEVWGNEAVVTPHFPIWAPAVDSVAVVRVLAAVDGTSWSLDGVAQQPLRRGVSVERPLLTPHHITASGPILVAQYEHSVNGYVDNFESAPGDPFMMIVPPPEQFDTAYAFQAVSHSEFHPWAHYVNVVIPTAAAPSLRIDGAPVSVTWDPVPKPGYVFAQINISPGSHSIRADSAFGLYSYGFGPASSYGYTGGMLFRTLVHDFLPPEIEQAPECDSVRGLAHDDQLTDTGIDSLYMLPRSRNVTASIEPFVSGADTVRYVARLVDPYRDGELAMKAIDSGGRSRTIITPVPGFTVRAVGMGSTPRLMDTLHLFNGVSGCVTIELENNGAFPHTVTRIWLRNSLPGSGIAAALPMTLAPGERRSLEVCMTARLDTSLLSELVIGDDCTERTVALLPIEAWTDTLAPGIAIDGSCDAELTVTLEEFGRRNSGIASYRFLRLDNAVEVSSERDTTASVVNRVSIRLRRTDVRRDIIYTVEVVDQAGNRTTQSDTIAGFTLAYVDVPGDTIGVRFGKEWRSASMAPSEMRCDSVLLVNHGLRPMVITFAKLLGNVGYSIPASQLPLTILPGERRRVAVCIQGVHAGLQRDTLRIADACGNVEDLVLGVPVAGSLSGVDNCGLTIEVSSLSAARRTFVSTPLPSPTHGQVISIDIGLTRQTVADLVIVGVDAAHPTSVFRGMELDAGVHRITADISSLPNGTYFCRLTTAEGASDVSRLVIAR